MYCPLIHYAYLFKEQSVGRIFPQLELFINNGYIATEFPAKNGRTMLSTVRPPDQSAETQTKWKAILLTCSDCPRKNRLLTVLGSPVITAFSLQCQNASQSAGRGEQERNHHSQVSLVSGADEGTGSVSRRVRGS
jgi:hypothetical protein